MKNFFSLTLSALLLLSSGLASAEERAQPKDIVVGISDAYIPSNFDSGSDAFVVINGLFPNSCYKLKSADAKHIGANLHEVQAVAAVTGGLCLTVMVPFHREVQLGKLDAGTHSIRFLNGDGTFWEKQVVIEN